MESEEGFVRRRNQAPEGGGDVPVDCQQRAGQLIWSKAGARPSRRAGAAAVALRVDAAGAEGQELTHLLRVGLQLLVDDALHLQSAELVDPCVRIPQHAQAQDHHHNQERHDAKERHEQLYADRRA